MRKIRLTLQYDGTDYSGWQIQKNGSTIQGALEDAIFSITNDRSKVTGAGRTDAGVHAFEQVAIFETGSELSPDIFLQALNGNLPNDIMVTACEYCPEDFHPRYKVKQKTYSYIISNRMPGSVFLNRYSWQLNFQLNIEAMRAASEYLIGKHDFSSFQASGCGAKHPVRELNKITIYPRVRQGRRSRKPRKQIRAARKSLPARVPARTKPRGGGAGEGFAGRSVAVPSPARTYGHVARLECRPDSRSGSVGFDPGPLVRRQVPGVYGRATQRIRPFGAGRELRQLPNRGPFDIGHDTSCRRKNGRRETTLPSMC